MEAVIKFAIPVLPAANAMESLNWWTKICGFEETFRDATQPSYAGIRRGNAHLHISAMTDKKLARVIGDQTMVRLGVKGIEALYIEYQKRGGVVHPVCRSLERSLRGDLRTPLAIESTISLRFTAHFA